jgi:Tfp pilus assembly protein PilN
VIKRAPTLHLRVGRTSVRAEAMRDGIQVWAGEAGYADLAALTDAIARLAAEAPPRCRRLVATVEHPPVQLRTLSDIPPVKRLHLAALVAQQAGRFFRTNGHPLVTDAAWLEQGETRVARAAAVEEPLVEAIAEGARAAGLWLVAIAPADALTGLSLLPRSEREYRERVARRRIRQLAFAAGAIWLMAGALFVGRLTWERRAIERELAALARPLATVLDARRELRDAEATIAAVTAAERERRRSLSVVTAIARALPDSSVLTSLVWSAEGTGVISGAARRATDAVARLDRLGRLAGVRLEGPIRREPLAGREWERFTVVFGGAPGKGKGDGS